MYKALSTWLELPPDCLLGISLSGSHWRITEIQYHALWSEDATLVQHIRKRVGHRSIDSLPAIIADCKCIVLSLLSSSKCISLHSLPFFCRRLLPLRRRRQHRRRLLLRNEILLHLLASRLASKTLNVWSKPSKAVVLYQPWSQAFHPRSRSELSMTSRSNSETASRRLVRHCPAVGTT